MRTIQIKGEETYAMLDYQHLLQGKRALISTGARGIGKCIALLFARQGATVMVGGRNLPALERTVAELQGISPGCKGYPVDLGRGEETERMARQVLDDFGGVDILVNTVGVNRHAPAHEYQDNLMESFLESNYKSGMRLARAFLPGMMHRRSGVIVNISSIHAIQTMPGYALYAGTKGAVNAAARTMALDYASYGIRVNTICPGLILSDVVTDEINTYPEGAERDAFMDLLEGMQPLPPGKMEDVANAALFLASPMSAYTTGEVIMVDGGASIKAH